MKLCNTLTIQRNGNDANLPRMYVADTAHRRGPQEPFDTPHTSSTRQLLAAYNKTFSAAAGV
jgi:hypothetical protein